MSNDAPTRSAFVGMNLAHAIQAKATSGGTDVAFYQLLICGGSTMTKRNSNTSDFFAKYKHPKWQKRRLEIMELSGFECSYCGSAEKTLNVHHVYYINGRDPWDYKDEELQCLCADCHTLKHANEDRLKKALQAYKLMYDDMDEVVGFIDAKLADGPGHKDTATCDFYSYIKGYCLANNWEYTNDSELKMMEVYSHMGGLYRDAFQWIFREGIDAEYAKHLIDYGLEDGDKYPSWLFEKAKKLIISAVNKSSLGTE